MGRQLKEPDLGGEGRSVMIKTLCNYPASSLLEMKNA